MAKRSAKHQSFKLTPHNHPSERVMLYIAISFSLGFVFGLMFTGQALAMAGLSIL